jgi:hypothetical protein
MREILNGIFYVVALPVAPGTERLTAKGDDLPLVCRLARQENRSRLGPTAHEQT